MNTSSETIQNSLYQNVDYDLLRSALQDLSHLDLSQHEDSFDACKRVIERKIQEATGMKLGRLLKEDSISPLYRRDYMKNSNLYSNV